jgi:hypothetical protein
MQAITVQQVLDKMVHQLNEADQERAR